MSAARRQQPAEAQAAGSRSSLGRDALRSAPCVRRLPSRLIAPTGRIRRRGFGSGADSALVECSLCVASSGRSVAATACASWHYRLYRDSTSYPLTASAGTCCRLAALSGCCFPLLRLVTRLRSVSAGVRLSAQPTSQAQQTPHLYSRLCALTAA